MTIAAFDQYVQRVFQMLGGIPPEDRDKRRGQLHFFYSRKYSPSEAAEKLKKIIDFYKVKA